MTVRFEYEEALQILKEVVAEKGTDYVYPRAAETGGTCVYFEDDGKPSCIVGHALARKGMTLEQINYRNDSGFIELCDGELVDADERAYNLLARVQDKQDRGSTWGSALQSAVLRAEESYDID